jgi:hypothetical protein
MFFLFFLFIIIIAKTETNIRFYLATLDSNLNMNLTGTACQFNTNCSDMVCMLLGNKKLRISAVMIIPTPISNPISNPIACPYIKNDRKVNMISFVTSYPNLTLNSPTVCSSINECLSDTCDNFDSTKGAFSLAFFGYCY